MYRKHFLKGLGANTIGLVLLMVSRLIFAPIFLKAWGVDLYGEWLILSSVVAYLSLTDLGGQLYIVNRLTQAYAKNEYGEFRRVLHTGLALFLTLPLVVYLLFIGVVVSVHPETYLQISVSSHDVVTWVLAILGFQFLFSLPQGLLLGVYRATGMLPRGVMLANLALSMQIFFVFVGLKYGGDMVLISLLQIAPIILVAFYAVHELNRRFPQFALLSFREFSLTEGLSLIKPSMHFLLIQVSQTISIQGPVLIIGVALGSVQVVVFSTMRTIANLISQLLGLVARTAWPDMTSLDAQQDMEKLKRLFRIILRLSMVGAVVPITLLHFFGEHIYQLWLGQTVIYQQVLMDFFLVFVLQAAFWTAYRNLLMAINHHHTLAKMLFVSSLLSIGLAIIGGFFFGLSGVVIGMLVGDLVLPFWAVPFMLSRYDKRFNLRFFLAEGGPVLLGLTLIVVFPIMAPLIILALLVWLVRCLPLHGIFSKKGFAAV